MAVEGQMINFLHEIDYNPSIYLENSRAHHRPMTSAPGKGARQGDNADERRSR
jgi:hypothetical protein